MDDDVVAVLAYLDEYEADEDKKRTRNERKRKMRRAGVYADPNRVRNQRRHEIKALKEQETQLTMELQLLKSHKTTLESHAKVEEPLKLWKQIADSQRKRRMKSEAERLRLQGAVKHQQEVAKSLSSLIERRTRQLEDECKCWSGSCKRHQVVHVLNTDLTAFQGLLRHLEVAYRDVDAVFSANGLADMVVTPSDVHIREANGGKYLELFANKVLPFGLKEATEVMWEHFSSSEKHWGNGSLYEKAAKVNEPYTLIEDFTKELFSDSSKADIKVKQVVRRHVEGERDVVIWTSRVSPVAIRNRMLRGLTYNLRGYAVMKRSAVSTPEQGVSQMQSCTLIFLDQEVDAIYGPDNLRALADFLVVNSVENIRAHQARIENMLVDRMTQLRIQ